MAEITTGDFGVTRLHLSKDEAYTLSAILAYVGGDEVNSPRKHATAIHQALMDAGFDWTTGAGAEIEKLADQDNYGPGVYFKDYPKPFVPGYFVDEDNVARTNGAESFAEFTELHYVESQKELDEVGARWVRVNVTLAE